MQSKNDTFRSPPQKSSHPSRQFFLLERHCDPRSDAHQPLCMDGGGCSSNSNSGCCNSNASSVGDNP